ncbi:MAG: lipoate--protein ligase family protein [Planctomycetota bacterium]
MPLVESLSAQEALARELLRLAEGRPRAWFWEAAAPAVILGASNKPEEELHSEHVEADVIPVLKRRTGGGAVLVGPGALCWGMILPPRRGPCNPRALAREVLPELADGLQKKLGAAARLAGLGDLAVGGKKIGGTAQRWTRGGILLHGTVLVRIDLALFTRYLRRPSREPDYRSGRSHEAFCTDLSAVLKRTVSCEEAAGALAAAWAHFAPLRGTMESDPASRA